MRVATSLIALSLLLSVTACDSTPTAPAADDDAVLAPSFAVLLQGRFPFGASLFVCTEMVDFSGTFHVVVAETEARSGNFSAKFHINAKGTGVGQTSGATYQWNDNIDQTVTSAGVPFTVTFGQTWKLIGKGQADNFVLRQIFHGTINANGDITVVHDRFEVTCK